MGEATTQDGPVKEATNRFTKVRVFANRPSRHARPRDSDQKADDDTPEWYPLCREPCFTGRNRPRRFRGNIAESSISLLDSTIIRDDHHVATVDDHHRVPDHEPKPNSETTRNDSSKDVDQGIV